MRALLLLLASLTLNASAQTPEIAPDASTPAPPPVPAEAPARPSFVVPEPTSGLPPGRLIPLPKMTDAQLHELASDLASHVEITGGYRRVPHSEYAAMSAFPPAVTADAMIVRQGADFRDVVRFGHVTPPRRLPQLWVQGYRMRGTKIEANPDAGAASVDHALKLILAERTKIFARLRLADLATRTVPLSYVDAEAALFALRAMGYSVVTDSESMLKDDSYKGEDVESFDLARPPQAAQAPPAQPGQPPEVSAAQAAFAAIPADEQKRFLPRFPAIRNLPTTIALDRLPLVVKIPSTDKGNMGLVGGELPQSQRDALGLTIIPSAASPLAETVAGGSSELLVIYHPDYPEQLVKMRRLIRETIDRPARQVYVEGLVLEISQEGLKELGVQWDIKKGSQSFSLGSLIPVPPGGNALSIVRDSTLNVSPTQIAARVNALVQTNKAEVLSRPSIITLDNRQATIRVGTDIPVSTSQDASSAGTGSNRVAFSFQYIPTGILLNVRPRISDDLTEISMLIDATVSATVPGADLQVLDPVSRIALASAPTISTRRVQTYARILDNQPLIIGGLLSRNQIVTRSKVPLLGDLPFVGALFGHTSREDDRREVIIVLTPSIVTENIRETKAQYPKDDDRFDQLETSLFKEQYRLRASDLVDSSDIRFNLRFRTYRDIANKVIERKPELATRAPFSQFAGSRVPAEFFFVTGMMYRMLERHPNTHLSPIENFKFFERAGPAEVRPVSVAQALAGRGGGTDPQSFFERNPGKALALTILLQGASDLRRLQLAYATQNTVLNNGGIAAQVFDRFLVGRMLHMQEIQPSWERILNAQIAQYFFIGEHWYMYFIQEHQKAMASLEAALRSPGIQPLLEDIKVP